MPSQSASNYATEEEKKKKKKKAAGTLVNKLCANPRRAGAVL